MHNIDLLFHIFSLRFDKPGYFVSLCIPRTRSRAVCSFTPGTSRQQIHHPNYAFVVLLLCFSLYYISQVSTISKFFFYHNIWLRLHMLTVIFFKNALHVIYFIFSVEENKSHLNMRIFSFFFCLFCFCLVPILPSFLCGSNQVTSNISENGTDSTDSPSFIQSFENSPGNLGTAFAPPNQNTTLSSDPTFAQRLPDSNCSETGTQLDEVNIKVGLLLASKATVQLIINPFIGPLTDRWVTLIFCHVSPSCFPVC